MPVLGSHGSTATSSSRSPTARAIRSEGAPLFPPGTRRPLHLRLHRHPLSPPPPSPPSPPPSPRLRRRRHSLRHRHITATHTALLTAATSLAPGPYTSAWQGAVATIAIAAPAFPSPPTPRSRCILSLEACALNESTDQDPHTRYVTPVKSRSCRVSSQITCGAQVCRAPYASLSRSTRAHHKLKFKSNGCPLVAVKTLILSYPHRCE